MEVLAILATLAIAFGVVKRVIAHVRVARFILGCVFGLFAAYVMVDPMVLAPGIIFDMRSIPVVLAAGFLGWEGTLACTAIAVAARVGIGGAGALAGTVGLMTVALAGRLWALRFGIEVRHSLTQLALLGSLASTGLPSLLLLPGGVGPGLVASVTPYFVPLQILGTVLVGSVIDRERMLLRHQRLLEAESSSDPLTGLLNRRGFLTRASASGCGPRGAALLLVDLDRFKDINDRFGHAAGDAVLTEASRRLRDAVGKQGLVGRLGGDELVVYAPDMAPGEVSEFAAGLCKAVASRPVPLDGGKSVGVTFSIGCATAETATHLDDLLSRADAAMYEAKQAGRNRAAVRTPPQDNRTAFSTRKVRA